MPRSCVLDAEERRGQVDESYHLITGAEVMSEAEGL